MGAIGNKKHTIEDEGIPVTDRDSLNFVGTGVTVTDDAGKTKVDIPTGVAADIKVNVFEAGIQIGTVARQLDFTDVNDFIITEDVIADQINIAIKRNIANGIAALDASGRVAKAQQHLATLHNDAAMIFTAAFTHNFLGGTLILDAAGNIRIDNSVVNVTKLKHSTNFPNFALLRNQLVADGSTAGKVSFRSKDDVPNERVFGEIKTIIEDTTAVGNLVHGSFHILVLDTNVLTNYMNFNDAKSGQIGILKPTLFADVDVFIKDNRLRIESPDGLTPVTIVNLQQTLARNLTIPIMTANQEMMLLTQIQTIFNKTFDSSNVIQAGAYDALSIASGDIGALQVLNAKIALGTAFQRKRTNSGVTAIEDFTEKISIEFILDGGGSVLTTGIKGVIRIEQDCEITRWALMADQSGSIIVDINRYTSLANYDAGTKASITGTDTPDLVSDKSDDSVALTGWTVILNEGDILEYEIDSITTIERATLSLRATKRG